MSIQGLGTDLELLVNGKPMDGAILETIVDSSLTLTAQGSSTIATTAKDPAGLLVKSDWFSGKAEAHLDGLPFKAVAFEKKTDEYTLEFEDRDFWLMKEGPQAQKQVKVFRGSKTLQEFVKEQCRRLCPHANFVCPGLSRLQEREPEKIEPGEGTFKAAAGGVKIKGKPADADQLNNLNIILAVIHAKSAPLEACLAILEAGLAETVAGFASETDPLEGSTGVFQINPQAHPGLRVDTKQNAEEFLTGGGFGPPGGANKLAREGKKAGEIAKLVEEPNKGPEFFEAYRKEAEGLLKNGGGAPSPTRGAKIVNNPEFFELNSKAGTTEEPEEEDETAENALSGIESYLKPGKWLFWKVGNTFYLYTEDELKRKGPVALLSEDTEGILDIGYNLDHSKKKVSKVIIECRAVLWEIPPGEVLAFHDSMGAAISRHHDGTRMNWLVLNIERKDITDNATIIELIPPEQGKREPGIVAKEEAIVLNGKTGHLETVTNPHGTTGAGKLKVTSSIWQVYVQAKWIGEQDFYYYYGGGHSGFHADPLPFRAGPKPNKLSEDEGIDCSGVLSWALHEAGLWGDLPGKTSGRSNKEEIRMEVEQGREDGPFDTQMFEKDWGEPGEGKYITLWVTNSATQDHCFLWIRIPSAMRPEGGPDIDYALEASHTGATVPAPHGVGLRPRLQSYPDPSAEGFTARHWPGT
jgi:hypothetical protein